jgi:hypothetical protein
MVFNATFNNIAVIPWWSVLLVEETGVPSLHDEHKTSQILFSPHDEHQSSGPRPVKYCSVLMMNTGPRPVKYCSEQ